MYVTYTHETFCGTVYFTKPTLTSANTFRLNSKFDVTLSFTPPKRHSGYRLQFITKIAIIVLWQKECGEKNKIYGDHVKSLPFCSMNYQYLYTQSNTEFQVLARQLTNHEQVKSKYTSKVKTSERMFFKYCSDCLNLKEKGTITKRHL